LISKLGSKPHFLHDAAAMASDGWQQLEMEQLCAYVNDNDRLQELSSALVDSISDILENEEEEESAAVLVEELTDRMDTITSGFVSAAMLSMKCVAFKIFADLEQEVFSKVFTPTWERRGNNFIATAVATFQDYFGDLQVWIASEFFFAKLLRECLERLVQRYVEGLCAHKQPFHDSTQAYSRILEDETTIVQFFSGKQYADVLRAGGLRSAAALQSQVSILSVIAHVLEPRENCSILHQSGGVAGLDKGEGTDLCLDILFHFKAMAPSVLDHFLSLRSRGAAMQAGSQALDIPVKEALLELMAATCKSEQAASYANTELKRFCLLGLGDASNLSRVAQVAAGSAGGAAVARTNWRKAMSLATGAKKKGASSIGSTTNPFADVSRISTSATTKMSQAATKIATNPFATSSNITNTTSIQTNGVTSGEDKAGNSTNGERVSQVSSLNDWT